MTVLTFHLSLYPYKAIDSILENLYMESCNFRDFDALQFVHEFRVRAKILETVAKFIPATKRT